MSDSDQSEQSLIETATGWIMRLQESQYDPGVQDELEGWLAASPAHAVAWQRANRTWDLLGALPREAPALAMPVEVVREAVPPAIRPLPPAAGRRPARRRLVWIAPALIAASLLWLAMPGLLLGWQADHRTAAGQSERIRMEDGSLIELGGQSAIATRLEPGSRHVRMLAGEAFFDIARDESRPFLIDTPGGEIAVLGTAFDLRTSAGSTVIALLHGAVELRPRGGGEAVRMLPGQRLVIDHASGALRLGEIAPEEIGAWRQGMVFLSEVSFAEVVEVIQRYHPAWITLRDSSLAGQRVSGLFDLTNPDRALAALVMPFGARVQSVTPYLRIITR